MNRNTIVREGCLKCSLCGLAPAMLEFDADLGDCICSICFGEEDVVIRRENITKNLKKVGCYSELLVNSCMNYEKT